MVLFEPQMSDNRNEEEIVFVRRSGRIYNKSRPHHNNEEHETIDLTLDGDSEDDKDNGVQLEGENVDNGEKNPVGMEEMEASEPADSLNKAEVHKKKELIRDKGTKRMEAEIQGAGKEKRGAGKRKMDPEGGKRKIVSDNGETGDFIGDKNAAAKDGHSTDDDFVSQHKTKIPKLTVSTKKTFTPKRFELKRKVGLDKKRGKDIAGASVGRIVSRVHTRNPPGNLFRVITQLSDTQKNDVRSMGFGEMLEFKIKDIPTRLAYWLLDRFDADTCTLDVNGRRISITPELVKNMLGVPMGDVHIQARDNSDYRNPLTKQWKGQFGKDVKKFYNTRVADEILKTKRGGWLFKLNFLVLFFSTIGELNLSNTVNLRFLPCINTEDDIPKLDWCTYIIECLVRTKKAWKRNAHFNGPIILLLVVYAALDTPIKHWSSDLLHKLEANMFPKTAVGDAAVDDRDVVEEIDDEGFDKDIELEDDVFEDDGSEGVPRDAEAMKKKAASYIKRAGELIDMADEVIDKVIQDNPDDYGLMELKELRDQLFGSRKYAGKPEYNEDPTEEAYEKWSTPERGENKKESGAKDEYVFPFTQVYGTPTELIAVSDEVCREWERTHNQIPTRLDFEDDAEFDLNLTQPPATQGKEVVDDMEADQVLLDSLTDYVSQEPADGGGFKTPDHQIPVCVHGSSTSNRLSRFGRESMANKSKGIVPVYEDPVPLNVVAPTFELDRAKRHRLLPEVLRSPYMTREVSLLHVISKHEHKVADCFFSARLQETDIVFKTRYVDGERVVLESLFPGIDIASGAIDLFTHVLNNAEKHRSKLTVTRLFCHTAMLTSDMVGWEYEKVLDKFVENMDTVVNRSEYKTLDGVQLVFFPIIQGRHFFVVCMNMKDAEVQILDNLLLPDTNDDERFTWFIVNLIAVFEDYLLHKNNPNYERMTHATRKVLQLGCRTTGNFVDCGVFTMRHMETYKGDGADLCCLSKEGKKQVKELRELRIKYAAKILLSDCNLVKSEFEKEVHGFGKLPVEERKRLHTAAFETIKLRVATKFEVK